MNKWKVTTKIEYLGGDTRDYLQLVEHGEKYFVRMGNGGSIYEADIKTAQRAIKTVRFANGSKTIKEIKKNAEDLEKLLNENCI